MEITSTKINIGIDKPFKLLHFSDTHLTYADERDCERKLKLASDRERYFKSAPQFLNETIAYAAKNDELLVCTGDLIDFVSYANLDAAKKFTDENDCFFITGNHEFSLFVGEAFEDEAYRNQSLERVQKAYYKDNIRFASRVVNGVNLVGIDDSYYLFEQWQLERLKTEVGRGLPILLFMHNPIYTPDLFDYIMNTRKNDNAALTCAPTELIKGYSEHRFRQQNPDAITVEMTEYIKSQPLIKAVITGHLHFDYETMLTDYLPQYVTGGNYNGSARELIVS